MYRSKAIKLLGILAAFWSSIPIVLAADDPCFIRQAVLHSRRSLNLLRPMMTVPPPTMR